MTNGNDYAVAKALNVEVMAIIIMVLIAYAAELPDDYEVSVPPVFAHIRHM